MYIYIYIYIYHMYIYIYIHICMYVYTQYIKIAYFLELGGETHNESRNRARTQLLPQAWKLHVSGSGTFRAFWISMGVLDQHYRTQPLSIYQHISIQLIICCYTLSYSTIIVLNIYLLAAVTHYRTQPLSIYQHIPSWGLPMYCTIRIALISIAQTSPTGRIGASEEV